MSKMSSGVPDRFAAVSSSGMMAVAFGLVIGLVVGCAPAGPAFNPVSGKVTIGGQLPSGVQISFYPLDSKQPIASGSIDAATGRYELTSSAGTKGRGKGAVAGKFKVVLNAAASGGGAPGSPEAMMAQYSGGGKAPAVPKATFPKEYGSASTSPKEVEVKSGQNTIDLEL